jgi:hypothetical protein
MAISNQYLLTQEDDQQQNPIQVVNDTTNDAILYSMYRKNRNQAHQSEKLASFVL